MAPQRGTKRAAQEAKDTECPAAKYLKQRGVAMSNFDAVVEAVEKAEHLPEECRKLLTVALPRCLGAPVDERVGIQVMVVNMVEEVIDDVQLKLGVALETEKVKVKDVDAARNVLEESLRKAEANQSKMTEVVKEKKAAVDWASQVVRANETLMSSKLEDQRKADAHLAESQASKEAYEAAFANDFKALRSSELETDQANAHFSTVGPLLSKCEMDVSLSASMHGCLTKRASERGSFDQMALDGLEKVLVEKIAELVKVVDDAVPVAKECAIAAETVQKELQDAKDHQANAKEEVTAAKADERDAGVAVNDAKTVLSDDEPEYTKATAARTASQTELDNFKDWHKGCFVILKDKLSAAAQLQKKEEEIAAKAADEPVAPMEAEALGA